MNEVFRFMGHLRVLRSMDRAYPVNEDWRPSRPPTDAARHSV